MLESKAKKIIQNPKNKDLVEKGNGYESRLRLITNPYFRDTVTDEQSYSELLNQMNNTIHKDKVKNVLNHMSFPLTVTALTEEIMRDINRVFEGRNMFFSVKSVNRSAQQTVDDIVKKSAVKEWIDLVGRSVLKNQPNTIVVLDRSKERGSYPIKVENSRLIDFCFKPEHPNEFEYISFVHSIKYENSQKVIFKAVYDSEYYRVYKCVGGSVTLDVESQHKLGYCPARMFLTQPATTKSEFDKKSPLLPVVGVLFDWTIYEAGKKYIDNYAPYPITQRAISSCDVEDCNGGTIFKDIESDRYDRVNKQYVAQIIQTQTPCPVCSRKSLVGPGTVVEIEATDNSDHPDARDIFKFISPDVKNLEYIQNRLDTIERKAHLQVTGLDAMITREAINADQVKGSFERAKSVLLGIKRQLDVLYIWMMKGLIQLESPGVQVSISANFGTDWYIMNEKQVQELFDSAKTKGLPESEINELYNMLIETKYRSNPSMVERLKMINHVSPSPYDTATETITKFKEGAINQADFILKMNFQRFLNRFERENGPIDEFGSEQLYNNRIESIYKTLITYTNEQGTANQAK